MSITFFCPEAQGAPVAERCGRCEWLSEERGEPVFGCEHALCEAGWWRHQVSSLPEVNLSNQSASAVLRLLGESAECGEWKLAALDEVIRRGTRALNSTAAMTSQIVAARVDGPELRATRQGNVLRLERGPMFIDCGLSEERLARKLAEVVALCVVARRGGFRVVWG